MGKSESHNLLPHLFRLEYTKMTAVLCRHFGLRDIVIAEDIASDTFLKASELWSLKGVPENPVAWLYTVAKNKAKDYLKRDALFENKVLKEIKNETPRQAEIEIEFSEQNIKDSQLAMIFAVCDPVNAEDAQICLALQVLCGFSVEEIANAFLSNREAIKKKLYRARENLRSQNFKIHQLQTKEITARLEIVLRTLYLLFNEGYFSKSNDTLIRKDLCSEAMRLTFALTETATTNTNKVNALLALQCFQSSRLDARIGADEEAILFEEQDKKLWDKRLIDQGNYFLVKACTGNELSKYHVEASIAYWHTAPQMENEKWKHILDLYNQLLIIEYSPNAALNRTFAFAKVHGNEKAIVEAELLNLADNHYYHSLPGYLFSTVDESKAIEHFKRSMSLTNSAIEINRLNKTIAELRNPPPTGIKAISQKEI